MPPKPPLMKPNAGSKNTLAATLPHCRGKLGLKHFLYHPAASVASNLRVAILPRKPPRAARLVPEAKRPSLGSAGTLVPPGC
jgi:hypothetical protein